MATLQILSKEEFAFRLSREVGRKRAEQEAAGKVYGLRTMARNIARRPEGGAAAGADEKKLVDTWRRQIQRYMKADHLPRATIRVLLAEEVGCSPEMFGVETEDETGGEADDDDPSSRDGAIDLSLLEQVRTMRRSLDVLERLVKHP